MSDKNKEIQAAWLKLVQRVDLKFYIGKGQANMLNDFIKDSAPKPVAPKKTVSK
jgi:hypothetical protein